MVIRRAVGLPEHLLWHSAGGAANGGAHRCTRKHAPGSCRDGRTLILGSPVYSSCIRCSIASVADSRVIFHFVASAVCGIGSVSDLPWYRTLLWR